MTEEPEIDRLRRDNERLRQCWNECEVRNKELEDAVARLVLQGGRLRDALRFYEPGPQGGVAHRALEET